MCTPVTEINAPAVFIKPFKPSCLFSTFKQSHRPWMLVSPCTVSDINLWAAQTADGLVTRYKWLLAVHAQPQQKSRRETRVWCGEFSFTSALPTGALGNIRLWCCQNWHQTCCAERSPTALTEAWPPSIGGAAVVIGFKLWKRVVVWAKNALL